jgi:uncharacterized damage-inducible protein DinB
MSADELAAAVGRAADDEMNDALKRIRHCVDQLSDEQVWSRDRPGMNSIGNLILHLCGNVRQWIVAGIGGTADIRDRPAEFAERGPIAKTELLRRLEGIVADATAVLARQTAADWLRTRRIQGYEVTGLAALLNTVPHFRGHTQEIVHMTRQRLGDAYQFAWKPQTPEQGA